MAGNCGSSTTTVASVMPQGCSSNRPPIISPNSGQEKKAVIAEWAATNPFPSSLTKDRRSARCSGVRSISRTPKKKMASKWSRFRAWKDSPVAIPVPAPKRIGRFVMSCESVRMNVS